MVKAIHTPALERPADRRAVLPGKIKPVKRVFTLESPNQPKAIIVTSRQTGRVCKVRWGHGIVDEHRGGPGHGKGGAVSVKVALFGKRSAGHIVLPQHRAVEIAAATRLHGRPTRNAPGEIVF